MITNYTGISGSRIAYLAALELNKVKKALIVVSTERIVRLMAEDIRFFDSEARVITLQEEEDIHVLYEARNRERLTDRIGAISALLADDEERVCVIAPVSAAVKRTQSPEKFRETVIELKAGDVISPAELRKKLVESGYESAEVTESTGEFTVRGGVIDVFSASYTNPVRIEFFDDEIDSIRLFDPDSQRSVENMKKIIIAPAAEFIPSYEERMDALKKIKAEYDRRIKRALSEHTEEKITDGRIDKLKEYKGKMIDMFEQGKNVQIYADLIEYFNIDKFMLWDYVKKGIVIASDPSKLLETLPEDIKAADLYRLYEMPDVAVFTPFPENIKGPEKIDKIVNIRSRQIASFNGQIDLFAKEIRSLTKVGYMITIVGSTEERNKRIREYLDIAEVYGDIRYMQGNLSSGFIFDDKKICFVAESDIFPKVRRTAAKKKRKKSGEGIRFSDLNKGNYVVHEAHGIGKFEGIKTMLTDGQTKDYLVIKYAGSDVLYIPTEQLDVIQKYIGSGGEAPRLSKLSGGSWKRTRERARKAIMEIAEDLVKLYAERKASGGHAFGEDTVWQAEFEADFPYTETEDQLKTAEEIKEDMQKPFPMDRLLCGDVGYGKTEVAARAIFKCISEGKQAAVLAPTTLLVNQHYHNFRERFENFPFEIAELSRFRTQKDQEKTCQGLADGRIDLVIGTHRLLSRDVKFNDLGLLVIDEEQRFGVQHKEQIKKLRKNIDVLTLSATPIPRTLNMSLTGIKDISTIEEPPEDRYPVQTFVTPFDEDVIKNAIERELLRGGQVFVVNNRVSGLKLIAGKIEELVPEAKTAVGHGRMSEIELENTMKEFIDGNYNVLVATTIIENGIDIPNANTMIILNADKLGLAQLYQLRGRVGRSERIAYAYLMYHPQKVLSEVAKKRLTTIREFTEFGAGFKIAMRDLELRGAGNILGEAQSGQVDGIGYELYCKEIDRAVRKLKGELVTDERSDISIEIPFRASIPVTYIESETLRLQAYKKIAEIVSQEDSEDIEDELTDRYGDPPEDVTTLIKVAEIRAHSEAIGIKNIVQQGSFTVFKYAESNNINAYAVVTIGEKFGKEVNISLGRNPNFSLLTGKVPEPKKILEFLRTLREACESSQVADNNV